MEIREKMIKKLKKFSKIEKKQQTDFILSNLTRSSKWMEAKKVGLYLPLPFEFDLTVLFGDKEKQILLPKCLPNHQMIFVDYDPKQLVKSNFGIFEPRAAIEKKPDFILVPGLAWNERGYRVGFGGGYYDRYLSHFGGVTASVCYDFQQINFEEEVHDVAVSSLFTFNDKFDSSVK